MNIGGMDSTYGRMYTPYQSNKRVNDFAGFMKNEDDSLTRKTAEESGKRFVENFMDYQELHKSWMSQNGAKNFKIENGVDESESAEEDAGEEKEMPEEEETKTEIVVRPDGSKVLMITVTVGGQEAVASVELSKPSKDDIPGKDISGDVDINNSIEKLAEKLDTKADFYAAGQSQAVASAVTAYESTISAFGGLGK